MVGRLLTDFHTCASRHKPMDPYAWSMWVRKSQLAEIMFSIGSLLFRSISLLFFHPSLVSAGCGCSRPPNGGFQNGRRAREGSPTLVETDVVDHGATCRGIFHTQGFRDVFHIFFRSKQIHARQCNETKMAPTIVACFWCSKTHVDVLLGTLFCENEGTPSLWVWSLLSGGNQ